MFKPKSKPKFRKKIRGGDDDGGNEDAPAAPAIVGAPVPPPAAATAPKAKKKASKGPALLSFDDDEEDEGPMVAMKPKKKLGGGGSSAKLTKKADRVKEKTSSYMSSAGEYSKEKLKELQKGTKTLPSSKKPAEEPALRLTGSFKPAQAARDDMVSGMDAGVLPPPPRPSPVMDMRGGGRADEEDLSFGRPSARPKPAPPPPTSSAMEEEDDGGGAQFQAPDEATIAAAKAKRERMRNAHSARPADYIALDSGRGGGRGGAGEDRKCDESDDSGDDDDQTMRVKFGVGGGGGRSVLAAADVDGHGDGSGDEEDRWVQEQIRKGVGAPQAREDSMRAAPPRLAPQARTGAAAAARGSRGGDTVLSTLEQSLARAADAHRLAKQQHRRSKASLQHSVDAVETLEKSVDGTQSRFEYMQEFRAYVGDLCACLADKGVLVEELEEHVAKLHEDRLRAMSEWRAEEEGEETGVAEMAVAAALTALSSGRGEAGAAAAAAAAAEEAERAATEGLPVKLDEFGRDENMERRAQARRRFDKRRARAARARARPPGGREGESDTDESEGEVERFRAGREEAVASAATVFADADEEFGTLAGVKSRLEQLKHRYPGAYRDAYMSLTAPQIFAPFARLELLAWSAVHPRAGAAPGAPPDVGFDAMGWYSGLFDYGMPPPGGGDPDPEDADLELVPKLVEKVALPAALHMVAGGWDPRSAAQTRAASAAVRELLVYVPPEAEMLRTLTLEVGDRLAAAVARISVPAWPPMALAASPDSAALVARRFGAAVRVMRNAGMWEGLLERGALEPVVFDAVLGRAVVPHLRMLATGDLPLAAARAERAAGAVPRAWVAGGCPAGARPLLDLVGNMAMQVQQGAAGAAAAAGAVAGAFEALGERGRAAQLARFSAPQ